MGIMSNKHKTSVQGEQMSTWSDSGSSLYDIKTGKLGKADSRQGHWEEENPASNVLRGNLQTSEGILDGWAPLLGKSISKNVFYIVIMR